MEKIKFHEICVKKIKCAHAWSPAGRRLAGANFYAPVGMMDDCILLGQTWLASYSGILVPLSYLKFCANEVQRNFGFYICLYFGVLDSIQDYWYYDLVIGQELGKVMDKK